jgi:hypothetical protein
VLSGGRHAKWVRRVKQGTPSSDAEKETAKLKQQIEEKASPETIALTANYTAAMLSSANVAPH